MEISAPAMWINQTFAGFDASITTAVHKLYELAGGFFTPFFEGVSFLGKGGICLILLSLLLMFYRPTRRFGTAMCLGLAIGWIVTNLIVKPAVARPRPYVDQSSIFYQFWLLVGQNVESDKSFPSGHTTAAFDCMTPVFILGNKRLKALALAFALLMGIAGSTLVVHFPSDVLAGMIVGIFAGCLAVLIAKKLPQAGTIGTSAKRKPRRQTRNPLKTRSLRKSERFLLLDPQFLTSSSSLCTIRVLYSV